MRSRGIAAVRALALLLPLLAGAQTRIGQAAPALRLGAIVQGTVADLHPNHAKLIEFWSSWCIPCRQEIPHLNQLAIQFKNRDIDFVSLAREPAEMTQRFLLEHPLRGIVSTDPDAVLGDALGVLAVPATALIDKRGRLAAITEPSLVNTRVLEALLDNTVTGEVLAEYRPAPELNGIFGCYDWRNSFKFISTNGQGQRIVREAQAR